MQRTWSQLSAEQQQELLTWKDVLCQPENILESSERLVEKFEDMMQRREQDLVRRKAVSAQALFTMHSAKCDSDLGKILCNERIQSCGQSYRPELPQWCVECCSRSPHCH
eukprot:s2106_g2.t1